MKESTWELIIKLLEKCCKGLDYLTPLVVRERRVTVEI